MPFLRLVGLLTLAVLRPANALDPAPGRQSADFDHSAFDRLLKAYVDEGGYVDYRGLKAHGTLEPYLASLATADPSTLSQQEQLAFWINAYNASTLKLIVDHYPTTSITKLVPFAPLGMKIFVPGVNSPFSIDFARVAGRSLSLDDIEHAIIRKQFDEPRIHFALVCAAVSCPPLRREAYVGARLDAQLHDQARRFLHDRTKNQIPRREGEIRLSKILDWYGHDFASDDYGLQQYLAQYFNGDVQRRLSEGEYRISFFSYDWALNDQARR